MKPDQITGNEVHAEDGSALDALIRFYRAFNHGDLDALAANWAEGERPSMDNPIGGIRRGWSSIRDGYQKLFAGPASVHVTFHDFTSDGGDDWHIFVGREKGTCTADGTTLDLRIRTTRWFVKIDGVWRQLHHHGSIEEPALLADYQRVIFGAPLGAPASTPSDKANRS
ncbi:YybH family protein [Paraburkholderia sp.]|uniref:YybH family protein n=1 Tax=Paraburkholderia sp. TaxID=1926495 RepID=UPI003D6F30E1